MKKLWLTFLLAACLTISVSGMAIAQSDGGYVPVPKSENTHPSYINFILTQDDKTYIVADYIDWYFGEEAKEIFAQREPDAGIDSPPNDYYIVNDNPMLRIFEVEKSAEVLMQLYNRDNTDEGAMDIIWNEQITLDKFNNIYASEEALSEFPYHLTIKDGKIVKIVQQFIP
ncbi:hypothetical protein D3C73_436660 [compost metagenome]